MMSKICGSVTGLLVLISGASMAASGFGMIDVMLSHKVSGIALVLVGLSLLVHSTNMCKCAGECYDAPMKKIRR